MSKENIKVDNIAIIRDYKLDYEDYLNELKSKLQNQKCHIECEMIWKLSKSKTFFLK